LHLSLDTDEGTAECDFLFTPVTGRRGSVEQIARQGRVQPSVQAPQGDRGALRDGIARTTRDLLYVFDRSVKPSLFLNERVHDVLGDGVDEIRRMTPETLKARIHPDDLPRVLAHYRKLADLPPGAVISIELRVRHADGHYVFLASKDTVLKSDGDQATKMVGCATDVSDHRHALGEVKKISKQLLRTQNEERRRIGRELHDSTAQHLVAVGIGLARLDMIHQQEPDARMGRAEVREVLVDARKSINEAQRELRALSYLLHPPTLERLGLSHTLRRFAAGFARRTKIRVDQAIQDDVVCRSREVATALLRVAQEALINVYHHADATSVAIRLAAADGRLTLEVEDDGKGLGRPNMTDLEDVDTLGVGIPGMRARVRQFHGELEIQSRENGVLVRATIPERARGFD